MPQEKPMTMIAAYNAAIAANALQADVSQRAAALALEQLYQQLLSAPSSKGLFSRRKAPTPGAAGLYLWGDVGRGKSMLMDMFVESIKQSSRRMPGSAQTPAQGRGDNKGMTRSVRRVHFHAFMADVHRRLFAFRQHAADAMEAVIDALAGEAQVLCLDEFQVSDVTDAMILTRLFSGLMDAGVTVVFTSNRFPRDLYQGGLQRDQFLKFVDLLEARIPIVKIESPHDYRLAQLKAMRRTYVHPLDAAADNFLLTSWNMLTHGASSEPLWLEVDGRTLRVDKHVNGIGWLTFEELCVRPLGANDYLTLARCCHTLLLQSIPKLSIEDRNEAKRFVTLIDALYDHRVKLIATAQTGPDDIYPAGDGSFEFHRTASRLHEMESEAYLALEHIG